MMDLLSRVFAAEEILCLDSASKKERVINALHQFSGLALDDIEPHLVNIFKDYLADINSILRLYDIKTFDDYRKIKEQHLQEMLTIIKYMCTDLRLHIPAVYQLERPTIKSVH